MPADGASNDVDLFGRRPKNKPDWSHRRGEPRGLALSWSIYLMLVTMGSLTPAMSLGRFEPDVYRPAARILMALIVVGMCVLWPMLRLTQTVACKSPGGHVARDLVVVLLPALTLTWPQVVLADWPAEVVAALTVLLIGWGTMTGVVLLCWRRRGSEGVPGRLVAMAVSLGMVAVAPMVLWRAGVLGTSPPTEAATPGWMWTPVTSAWEVLRDRGWSGRPARVGADHWVRALGLLASACVAFALLVWSCRGCGPSVSDPRWDLEH
ncbi:MAG: hypothetical protein K8E66_08395 [Phycisphaerales bacterium]|nr:hypothetical protein [Phycisphaerales bacterium]